EAEMIITIRILELNKEYVYDVTDYENIGFIFPVYFYSVPAIVKEFIQELTINNANYVYAIITCGGGIMQAGSQLKKLLQKREIKLNYVTPLLMPDNSMLFYQIPPMNETYNRLKDAKKELQKIKTDIYQNKSMNISNVTIISDLVGCGYTLCNKTSKFYANDACIHCGICERNCPQDVIKLMDGKPTWVKNTCSKCSACINRCPVQAIQYGKGTIKRNRYVHPDLKV
ncbi:MAG: 4Fe-4S binding protein, partial [Holdemanella sp.]|nr:4Fe-4S binding protein [Holdemanella sp.]